MQFKNQILASAVIFASTFVNTAYGKDQYTNKSETVYGAENATLKGEYAITSDGEYSNQSNTPTPRAPKVLSNVNRSPVVNYIP